MNRILAVLALLLVTLTPGAAKVIRAEYFFNTDPGVGNGTPIDLDPDDPGFTGFDLSIPPEDIAALGPGTHQVVVRYQDDTPDETLTSLESFTVTTDPVTSAVTISLTTEDEVSSGSDWSIAAARTFHVIPATDLPGAAATVASGEYLILPHENTTPPALGSGTPIPLGEANDGTHEIAFQVPSSTIATLVPGELYTLSLRFQDSLGAWSVTQQRLFMRAPIPEADGDAIVKGEYTIAAMDGTLLPAGLGSGDMLLLPDPVSGELMLMATLPPEDIAALDPGTYTITMRFQDDQGDWSIPQTRTFAVPDLNGAMDEGTTIVAGEYFILPDGDPLTPPALGSGTPIALPAAIDGTLTVAAAIPGSAFPPDAAGVHHLGVRFQDEAGRWSMTHTRTTLIPEPQLTAALMARLRYNIYDPQDQLVEEGQLFGQDAVIPFPSDVEDIAETHHLMVDPDPYRLEMYLLDNEGQERHHIEDTFTVVTHRDLWDALYFTDPADRADPLISGPLADPNHDGVPNLLAFVLGLDPLLDSCVLEFIQLEGEPHLTPLSQIPTIMPPGVTLQLGGHDAVPVADIVWTYETATDLIPQLVNTEDFSLLSPVEASRSDRLNIHAVLGPETRLRHFFDLCAELTGTWPFTYVP